LKISLKNLGFDQIKILRVTLLSIGEKPVTELAGIGAVLGGRLVEAGFDYVSML
jgi:hypothetical protein